MDRRLTIVIALSVVLAFALSAAVYRTLAAGRSGGSGRPRTKSVVLAVRNLPPGIRIKAADVKLARIPADQFPPGAFERIDDVIDRPVITGILSQEPIHEGRVAQRGSGFGLAPIIPAGMRAASVHVNEVVGVAGFVLPGMRVDVLVTGHPPGKDTVMTRTVLQNIGVASAGSSIEPDSRGRLPNVRVVTLLVTPEQAEMLALAGNEGKIQLVLRNGGDAAVQQTPGRDLSDLYGRPKPLDIGSSAPARKQRVAPTRTAPVLPSVPAQPRGVDVVVIRGNQKVTEHVATAPGEN